MIRVADLPYLPVAPRYWRMILKVGCPSLYALAAALQAVRNGAPMILLDVGLLDLVDAAPSIAKDGLPPVDPETKCRRWQLRKS